MMGSITKPVLVLQPSMIQSRTLSTVQMTFGAGLHLLVLLRQRAWVTRAGAPAAKLLGFCSPFLGCCVLSSNALFNRNHAGDVTWACSRHDP